MNARSILNDRRFQFTAVGVTSFAVGAGLVYFLDRRRHAVVLELLENLPELELLEEIPELAQLEEIPYAEDVPYLVPETKVEKIMTEYDNIIKTYQGTATVDADKAIVLEVDPEPEPHILVTNVFAKEDDEWNYENELATRTKKIPYVIHEDEFILDEMGFTQETLTYYAGDDIMADGQDTPLYNYEGLMGELMFGHGTKDPNVVYIRNEGIRMEWEILRHSGFFEVEVLGHTIEDQYTDKELKHSVQKFRDD